MHEIFGYIGMVTSLAVRAKAASDKLKDAELNMVMADLLSAIADLKMKNAEIISEKAELTERVANLERELEKKNKVKEKAEIKIFGEEHEQKLIEILIFLSVSDGEQFQATRLSKMIHANLSVTKHLLDKLCEMDLVIHHWGLGSDSGYSLARRGRDWLISEKKIQ